MAQLCKETKQCVSPGGHKGGCKTERGILPRLTRGGELHFQISYYVGNQRKKETFDTLPIAREARINHKRDGELRRAGMLPAEGAEQKQQTFGAYWDEWVQDHGANVSPGTLRSYQASGKHLTQAFGGLTLGEITPRAINRFKQDRQDTLSPRYINLLLQQLSTCLRFATEEELLPKVPKMERNPIAEDETYWLSTSKLRHDALAAMRTRGGQKMVTMGACMMLAGLRVGEMLALKRADIDLTTNRITVRSSSKAGEHNTKTGKTRSLPLQSTLKAEIVKFLKEPRQCSKYLFIGNNSSQARAIVENQRPRWYAYTKWIDRGQAPAYMTGITPHKLRHTFCSMSLEEGVPVHVVQQWMGHANIATTMRYIHKPNDSHEQDFMARVKG